MPKERERRELQFKKDRWGIEGSYIGRLFLIQNSYDLMFDGEIFCLLIFLASDASNEIILLRGFDKAAVVPGKENGSVISD